MRSAPLPCPACAAPTHPSFAPPHLPTCPLHGPVAVLEVLAP